MGLLSQFKESANVEKDEDVVGGGLSFTVDTGADDYTIELAYISESQAGAKAINLHLKNAGAMLRQTIYFTSNKAKGQKTTYTHKQTGKEHNLPGYALLKGLARVVANKDFDDLNDEKKIVKLYNWDQKKEVPTEVDILPELMGQQVIACVYKVIEDKKTKADDGSYVPTGETREVNEIVKFCQAGTGLAPTEVVSGESIDFLADWKETHTGKVKDKSTKNAGGAVSGAPAAAAPASENLFEDDE
jgi:hypothetical protein